MAKRISTQAWSYFKQNYPSDIENMIKVGFPISRMNVFIQRRRKKRVSKTNIERFGYELGRIIDWLDECCNDHYYAEFDEKSRGSLSDSVIINFYFMEDADAVAFRLMFE